MTWRAKAQRGLAPAAAGACPRSFQRKKPEHPTFNIQRPIFNPMPAIEAFVIEGWMLSVECWKLVLISLCPLGRWRGHGVQ